MYFGFSAFVIFIQAKLISYMSWGKLILKLHWHQLLKKNLLFNLSNFPEQTTKWALPPEMLMYTNVIIILPT